MPLLNYSGKKGTKGMRKNTLALIYQANEILEKFHEQGYLMTLRQLYYQMVAADLIPNTDKSYDRLGTAVSTGRERGLIDWDLLTDRTRELNEWQMYDNVPHSIRQLSERFRLDKWRDQPFRPEVWVEKDALSDVVRRACWNLQVPYMVCRGYMSMSAMWQSGQRMKGHREGGQAPIIFHLGDHDPSGLHMTDDNYHRSNLYGLKIDKDGVSAMVEMRRIALNIQQIEQYEPPPNPAKMTDSRYDEYVATTGLDESWELDALAPSVIEDLIEEAVLEIRDEDKWDAMQKLEDEGRTLLKTCSNGWSEVRDFLNDNFGK